MQIAEVIGSVTLSQCHPLMVGASLRLVVPKSLANLAGRARDAQEPLVAVDELGAGIGTLVALSEGREAAQPFDPAGKPVDAYIAALLDSLEIEGAEVIP